jgi:nitrate reductase alpha subunit
MTNHWVDIKNADVVLIMGGNAAEAHPCGFKWVTEAKAHNKAKLIVVDPRFTRSASVADYYAPIRSGTDIVFLGGLINYLLSNDKIQRDYVVITPTCRSSSRKSLLSPTASIPATTPRSTATTNPAGITKSVRMDSRKSIRPCPTRAASTHCSNSITRATCRRWSSGSAVRPRTRSCTSGT